MSDPIPYLMLPGVARDALSFYGELFGGDVQVHTYGEFHRTDGPADAVAHGMIASGPVRLFAADASGDEPSIHCEGLMLSLLGTANAHVSTRWFHKLSEGGRVVEMLQERPWGGSDGRVVDRFGVEWLIGFEGDQADTGGGD
jgi:PhnB protein